MSSPFLVKDINPFNNASNADFLIAVGNTLYFRGNNGINGDELWKSDGTTAGTILVKDINPGSSDSINGFSGVVVGNILYFSANDGTNGAELWKSDGTTAGTVLVKDINPGSSNSIARLFAGDLHGVAVGNTLYFVANDGTNGAELWKSDGTSAGTVLVKDIRPGSSGSDPLELTVVDNTLYFRANNGTNGDELWKSDGTAAGTVLVKDINPGSSSSNMAELTVVGNTLYFVANDGTNGAELWKSDGTVAGTVLVKDIRTGSSGSDPLELTVVDNTLYFRANNGTNGAELWKSNGTAAGTILVKDLFPGSASTPSNLTNVNDTLYFTAQDESNGRELWKSDGTDVGTVLVKDINPLFRTGSNIAELTAVGNTLYFVADDGTNGTELWTSDGTTAGTVLVELIPSTISSSPFELTVVGNTLYFTATDTSPPDRALWALNFPTTVFLSLSSPNVSEDGTSQLIYTFTRIGNTISPLTVNYTVGGTASLDTDYTGIATTGTTKTVTIPASSTTATVTVDPTADTTIEGDETVALTLASGTGYTVGTSSAVIGTIQNDDFPVITLTVSPSTVLEDGTINLVYTFTRTGPTTNALTINYTIGGTASLGTDYTGIATTGITKTVTIATGSTTATVTVDPTADTTIEGDETVALTLASGTGYTVGTSSAVIGTIQNDDFPVITLTVSPSTVLEDGTINLVYTFTRTGPTTNALTINYTVGGTASLGTDYTGIVTTGITKTVTIATGSTTATVTVDPTADTTIEGNETVALTLASGTGYTVGTSSAVIGTIQNDDPRITLTVSPNSVNEDSLGALVYTFVRTSDTTNALTVNYIVGGTANLGFPVDYTGIDVLGTTKTVTFNAGSATATVTVVPVPETTVEPDETVVLTLTSGTGYTIGTTTPVTGTIVNDDNSVTLAVSPGSVTEDGTTNLIYTFTRTGPTTNPLAVNYSIAGTASNGSDYASLPTSVTLAANLATATLIVDPTADTTIESDETVALTLVNGSGYTIDTFGAVIGTIQNDDFPFITLAVSPASVFEDGTTNLIYTFTRTGSTTNPLTVNYAVGGTAINGTDYSPIGTSVIFQAGSATATVTVNPGSDITVEENETVVITPVSGVGYTFLVGTPVVGSIQNDDFFGATFAISATNANQTEGQLGSKAFTFTVTRGGNGGTLGSSTIRWVVSGTGRNPTNGTDFNGGVFPSGTVSFDGGETSRLITVNVQGDSTIESNETFVVTLFNASSGTILTPSATGTIQNDDGTALGVGWDGDDPINANKAEGNSGNQAFNFRISRSGNTTGTSSVNWAVSGIGSNPVDSADFAEGVFPSGTVSFLSGETSQLITVNVQGDGTEEFDETFVVSLSNSSNDATITTATSTGTIQNDDFLVPRLSIQDKIIREGNSGTQNLSFTVTLSQASPQPISVNFATATPTSQGHTATSNVDFTATNGTLTIPAGQLSGQINVPIIGDTTNEDSETFVVNLSNPVDAILSDNQAVGTIEQDDTSTAPLVLRGGTVQIAYVAYYGRPGDPSGLGFWNGVFTNSNVSYSPRTGDGLTGSEAGAYNLIVDAFGNSSEANSVLAELNLEQKVNQVFQFCFNRDADPGGLAFWSNAVNNGLSLAQFALEIALGAQNEDIILLQNKISSANLMSNAINTETEKTATSTSAYANFGRNWLALFGDTSASLYATETALTGFVPNPNGVS